MQLSNKEEGFPPPPLPLPKSNPGGFLEQIAAATSSPVVPAAAAAAASSGTTGAHQQDGFFAERNKSLLIMVLLVLLVLAILGINLLNIAGNVLQSTMILIAPIINQLFAIFGYTTGNVLNEATDFTTDTLKLGVDIAGGTVKDLGGILIEASNRGGVGALDNPTEMSLDQIVQQGSSMEEIPSPSTPACPVQPAANQLQLDQQSPQVVPSPQTVGGGFAPAPSPAAPMPDSSTSLIQAPTTNWCLVGNYLGSRGCLQIDNHDQCQSKQIFPTREECVQPNSNHVSSTFVPQLFSTYSSPPNSSVTTLPHVNYITGMTYMKPEGPPNFPYLQVQ